MHWLLQQQSRKHGKEERRWTQPSLLLFLNLKGPFFFLTFLLFPKTSLEEAISPPPESEQRWYSSFPTFSGILPGDLLRSRCFLRHHFLLFFPLQSLWILLASSFSELFKFRCSLMPQGLSLLHPNTPIRGFNRCLIVVIHKDTSPGQPPSELQIPVSSYLLDISTWMASGLLNPICPELTLPGSPPPLISASLPACFGQKLAILLDHSVSLFPYPLLPLRLNSSFFIYIIMCIFISHYIILYVTLHHIILLYIHSLFHYNLHPTWPLSFLA